jgi:uncharacterized Zn-finger protein
MNVKGFLRGSWFQRTVLLAWIVSSGLVFFSQKTIDGIVNGTLYNYGLQFSEIWHGPYWTFANMLYYSQYVCIGLSGVALGSGFLKKKEVQEEPPKFTEEVTRNAFAREEANGRGIVIACSSCKKNVSKPLVMLDFSEGKAKLVNVCPYCNAVLGSAEKESSQNDEDVIVDPGKKVTH